MLSGEEPTNFNKLKSPDLLGKKIFILPRLRTCLPVAISVNQNKIRVKLCFNGVVYENQSNIQRYLVGSLRFNIS